jgi:hypothetical protein
MLALVSALAAAYSLNKAAPQSCGPNVAAFDRYSLAHLASGALSAYAGMSFGSTLLLNVAWEASEDAIKEHLPAVFPEASKDSKENALADLLCVVVGYAAVSALVRK